MRRLIIDGQLFQTPAWHRGMGKYSMELLNSLTKYNDVNKVWDSMELLLSDLIPVEPAALTSIKEVLPGVKITKLNLLPAEVNNLVPTEKNKEVVEEHLAATTKATDRIDFFILSVLQGGIAPAFPDHANVHKILLFYDLIPLMFFTIYLSSDMVRQEYATHFGEFFKADTYLTISKTVANDLAWHTGTSYKRIFNINGGPIKHGNEVAPVDMPKPFILMHTGDDLRKNNRRGILAFEDFNQKHENKYTLVVSSTFTEHEMRELKRLSKNVVFTGNVSGEELNYLYKECEALFFPTEYEGLGLPVLEAMEWEKPILCSDIPVFREITPDLVEYFNHRDTADMSAALDRLVQGKVVPDVAGYKKVLARYTWKLTAQDAVRAILRKDMQHTSPTTSVAVFTPNPSQSLIGKHVQMLGSELSRLVSLKYRYEGVKTKIEQRVNYTSYITPGSGSIDGRVRLDVEEGLCLYHLANHSACAKTLFAALGNPGIVILYDQSLQLTWEGLKDLGLAHHSRLAAEVRLNEQTGAKSDFLTSIVASQKAIVVHDQALLKKLKKIADKLGRDDIKLSYVPIPAVETVYPDILPERKFELVVKNGEPGEHLKDEHVIVYSSRDGLKTANGEPLSDHRLLELVSDSSVVKINDKSYIGQALTALGETLGVGSRRLSMPERRRLIERTRKEHTYLATAQAINKLVQELTHEA